MRRVRLIAEGQVQGVWFRASARDRAVQLGLSGWARNLPDGRVEVQAQGGDAGVETFIAFCRAGPGRAVVEALDMTETDPRADETGFQIR